jgi:hypothetical protein
MMRLSQEAITEKIDRLKRIRDKGRGLALVKPVLSMGWKGNVAVHLCRSADVW